MGNTLRSFHQYHPYYPEDYVTNQYLHYDYKKCNPIGNLCRIQNITGGCAFNVTLQLLFASGEFNRQLNVIMTNIFVKKNMIELIDDILERGSSLFDNDNFFNKYDMTYYEYVFVLYACMISDSYNAKTILDKVVQEFVAYLLYYSIFNTETTGVTLNKQFIDLFDDFNRTYPSSFSLLRSYKLYYFYFKSVKTCGFNTVDMVRIILGFIKSVGKIDKRFKGLIDLFSSDTTKAHIIDIHKFDLFEQASYITIFYNPTYYTYGEDIEICDHIHKYSLENIKLQNPYEQTRRWLDFKSNPRIRKIPKTNIFSEFMILPTMINGKVVPKLHVLGLKVIRTLPVIGGTFHVEVIVRCAEDNEYYRISDTAIGKCEANMLLPTDEYSLKCGDPFCYDNFTILAMYHLYSDVE